MNRKFCICPSKALQAVVVLTTALVLVGCGAGKPDIVPVSGTVTIGGKPLANVEVRYIPTQEGLDGNMIGSGITDSEGKYTISLPGKSEPGGCACPCKVTITEGPIPGEVREASNPQMAATRFKSQLKNRPIPTRYLRMADTPITQEVTADQGVYDLELER